MFWGILLNFSVTHFLMKIDFIPFFHTTSVYSIQMIKSSQEIFSVRTQLYIVPGMKIPKTWEAAGTAVK